MTDWLGLIGLSAGIGAGVGFIVGKAYVWMLLRSERRYAERVALREARLPPESRATRHWKP